MRLLDFVEQDDAVRTPADGLGEDAALAVADISGRRSLERGDGVLLLELAHVDGDDVLLTAVERLGQRQRRLGLSDARRPAQHEHADRLVGIVELRPRRVDAPRDHVERVALADDTLVEGVSQMQQRLDFVLHHAADRHAGPVLDDGRHGLLVDARKNQRRLPLQRREL